MSNILSLKIQLFLIITRITRKFIPENKILGITCNRYNKLYVRKLLENSIRIKIIYDSNNRIHANSIIRTCERKLFLIRIIQESRKQSSYN